MSEDERLIRWLEGTLPPGEEEAFRRRLEEDPRLRGRVERWRAIEADLRATRTVRFGAGFRDAVAARVRGDRRGASPVRGGEELYDALRWTFPRLAVACLVGIVAVSAWTLLSDAGFSSSVVEALLGVPERSLETLLLFGAA